MDTIQEYKPLDIQTPVSLRTTLSGQRFLVLKDGKYQFPIGPLGYIPKSGLCFYDVLAPIVNNKKILDLGCGEMGIISLISILEGASQVTAIDIDERCLYWLNHLKTKFHFNNLEIFKSDMFQAVHKKFDVIVSNPPIMPMPEINEKNIHDSGGKDGRIYLNKIMKDALSYLNDNGQLYLSAFSFLGTDTPTGKQLSLKQYALNLGYSSFDVVARKRKILSDNSLTYKQLPYIKTIYPYMKISTYQNKPTTEFQILRLCK
ncbi:MAG: methyltransferase [Alphaproteobacteria bacterium]|nr:methyltransferase [Alphaproteobacteria bacterium]